jgi:hypothetical protein
MKIERSWIKEQSLEKELRAGQESILSGFESLLGLVERGSEDGAELMSYCLINILAPFLEACDKKPELFYAAAEERSIWPGLIVLDRWIRSLYPHYDLNRIRKLIHLGERRGLKYDGKLAGSAVGSQVARRLFAIIDAMRREDVPKNVASFERLPKLVFEVSSGKEPINFTQRESGLVRAHAKRLPVLSRNKGVLAKWWRVMRPLFIKVYGSHFEDHKEFAKYRKDVEDLSKRKEYATKFAKDYQKRKYIKGRIRNDIRQGLCSIAAEE